MEEKNNISYLGQILIHLGITSNNQISEALKIQRFEKPYKRLGEILLELGYISTQDLNRGLSIQHDLLQNQMY